MNKPTRIVGLDIARSLAIIGMIIVHMASLLWSTKVVLSGLPSSLFAIIAGSTMMIIGRNYSSTTFLRLITRGALIILIVLALLPPGNDAGFLDASARNLVASRLLHRRNHRRHNQVRAYDAATDLSATRVDCIFHRRHAALRRPLARSPAKHFHL